jgi:hypothetical protein
MMPSASLSLVFFYSIASTLMHSLNSHTHHFIALISRSHHSRRRLTDAQIARTVALVAGSSGMLCTQVAPDIGAGEGANFPCPAPFIVDADGCPLMPIASKEALANLQHSKTGTFFARAPKGGAAAESVVTLIGEVDAVAEADVGDAELRDISNLCGLPAETVAAYKWVRLSPSRVHVFDAVRNVEAWVPPAEYAEAEPNPLASASTNLLSKMNTQHAPALRRFAAVYSGVPPEDLAAAELLAVDQMGFDLRVQLGPSAPVSLVRAGFKMPPANEEEGISVFMKLFQEAYERANPKA